MLHLYIQKEKEAVKTSNFQKDLGGTVVCMNRLMMATKGCRQLKPNYIYFSDSWFSGIKNAEETRAEVVDYCRPAKTIHKGFCLAILEKLMKDFLGASYHVMKSTPRVTCGRALITIGYRYNYRKV